MSSFTGDFPNANYVTIFLKISVSTMSIKKYAFFNMNFDNIG